ncbi:hypothetical protein CR513_20520, partial [Mucuna pruriens]
MEDNETINLMFGRLQTNINNLISPRKTYDNYDYITKSLPRRWRPQVTALKASKDLKKFPMEELLGSMSKAFKVKESCGNTLDEDCFDEDELSFI